MHRLTRFSLRKNTFCTPLIPHPFYISFKPSFRTFQLTLNTGTHGIFDEEVAELRGSTSAWNPLLRQAKRLFPQEEPSPSVWGSIAGLPSLQGFGWWRIRSGCYNLGTEHFYSRSNQTKWSQVCLIYELSPISMYMTIANNSEWIFQCSLFLPASSYSGNPSTRHHHIRC